MIKPCHDYYTWEQFDIDCQKIAQWAKDKQFKNVLVFQEVGLSWR